MSEEQRSLQAGQEWIRFAVTAEAAREFEAVVQAHGIEDPFEALRYFMDSAIGKHGTEDRRLVIRVIERLQRFDFGLDDDDDENTPLTEETGKASMI